MKKNKLLIMLMIVSLIGVLCAFTACTNQEKTTDDKDSIYENFEFETDYNDNVILTNVKDKNLEEIIIPETYEGKPIYAIGKQAFTDCNNIVSINIPNIKNLGEYSFADCKKLKTVEIAAGVANIGRNAFDGCVNLETVHIEKDKKFDFRFNKQNLKQVKQSAFANCKKLKEINIPLGYLSIEKNAFINCESLIEIHLPHNCIICDTCFKNCSKLKIIADGILLGEFHKIKNIESLYSEQSDEESKFGYLIDRNGTLKIYGYTGEEETITIPESIKHNEKTYKVKGIGGQQLYDFSNNVKNIILSNGIEEINFYGFANMEKLESIFIPKSVTEIGYYAFNNCPNLKEIRVEASEKMENWDEDWNSFWKIDAETEKEINGKIKVVYNCKK